MCQEFSEYKGFCPDDFNGILFILREPNTDGKKEEPDNAYKWIESVLTTDEYPDSVTTSNEKRAVTTYRNKIEKILQIVCNITKEQAKSERKKVAYDNIIPCCGEKSLSDNYKKFSAVKDDGSNAVSDRVAEIIENINDKNNDKNKVTTVITCYDIYSKVKSALDKTDDDEKTGICYNNGTKHYRFTDGDITYYSIYHPTARVAIKSDN